MKAILRFLAALVLMMPAWAEVAFVSTETDDKIVRISAAGGVSDYVASSLSNPRGIAFDRGGNTYVANYASGNADGSVLMFPAGGGAPVPLATGLNGPTGIALDQAGAVYVAVSADHRVIKITAPGSFTTFATLPAAADPQGIAFGPDGNLFVANKGANSISEVTPGGSVSEFSDDVNGPTGVAFDESGAFFAVHGGANGVIARFNPNGKASNHVTGFNNPRALAVDRVGNFYVVNGGDNALKLVTPSKAVSTLAPGLAGPQSVAVQGPRFEIIARKGETLITEPAGAKFNFLSPPAVAATGHVAYRAALLSGVAGVAGSNANGIWRDAPNGVRSLIARQSFSAPGTTGAVFLTFSDPVINDMGSVAFRATLRTGTGDATVGHTVGIWSDAGGSLALVARQGGQPAGIATTARFVAFSSLVLPETDGPLFLATVAGTGITATTNMGIWSSLPGGALQLLLRKGDPVTVNGKMVKVTGFATAFKPVAFQPGQGRTSAQDGGVAILATLSDLTTAILRIRDGAITVTAYKGELLTTAPAGEKIVSFLAPAIGASGDVAYFAKLAPSITGVTAANASGIWTNSEDNTRTLVARATFPAAGTNGAIFATFSSPAINNAGEVAFRATLKAGLGDAVAGSTIGLWSNKGGDLALIARQGQPPPGLASGTKFTAFTSYALPEVGDEVLVAFVSGTGITTANNQGIWAMDKDRILQLVIRKGDKIEVDGAKKTITALKLFQSLPFVSGQERNYAANGDIAFLATFSDATTAIVHVSFPP